MDPQSTVVESPAFLAQTRAPQILIGSIIPTVFATVFVFSRFYSRLIILKSWGLDDSLICVSWIVTLILAILTCVSTKYGAGRHMGAVNSPSGAAIAMKLAFVSRVLYQLCLATTKLGICAFYHRVFQDRTSKRLVYLMVAFISITSISLLFGTIFQCRPIAAAWSTNYGLCLISVPQLYALGITSIAADVFMLVFVVPRILGLRLARKQKISCLAIVSLSGLSIVAAALRLDRLLWTAHHSDDLPWNSYDVGIWNLVEVDAGLFCASAPAIKPLIRKVMPDFLSSLSERTIGSTRRTQSIGTSRSRGQGVRRSDAFKLSSSQSDNKISPIEITRPRAAWHEDRKTSSDSEAAVLGLESVRYASPSRGL